MTALAKKRVLIAAFALLALAAVLIGATAYLGLREDERHAVGAPLPTAPTAQAEQVERGAYLARAGNCYACHTTRGGADYAGGRAIQTPFGAIYASNITPDEQTGIGSWSADDFWRALHNGKGKDGKLLYPAFPYPNYTKVTRNDADAMYAYFRTLAPVRQENREPELRFPYNQRVLLAGWRALYFRPGVYEEEAKQGAQWNRGAYLVQGLGHCSACHAPRNALGATSDEARLSGGMIPMLGWYASSLAGDDEDGLGTWDAVHLATLLKTGVSERGVVSGPMAEVVRWSTQHLTRDDIGAMTLYLKSLPKSEVPPQPQRRPAPEDEAMLKLGATLYEKHCVDCHKANGTGAPPHLPPLAGNASVMLAVSANPIRAILHGGYPPSTHGNPQPYGMPPFGNVLSDEEVAAVLSYVRNAWGNQAGMVSSSQVNRYRALTLD